MAARSNRGVVRQGAKAETTEEYPLTEAIAWTRLPAGWVVTAVKIQGGEIIATECLSPQPETSKEAAQRVSVESAARFGAAVGTRGLRS